MESTEQQGNEEKLFKYLEWMNDEYKEEIVSEKHNLFFIRHCM